MVAANANFTSTQSFANIGLTLEQRCHEVTLLNICACVPDLPVLTHFSLYCFQNQML
jgi:hypothetical protein